MDAKRKNECGSNESPAERRRCPKCGKILAERNRGPDCFSCHLPRIIDVDEKGRVFKRLTTFKVISPPSLCSSRETRGFDRAYRQYHGWRNGL